MKTNPRSIGPAELPLLQFISERGPCTVREVFDTFGSQNKWGRTTVLKTMERLRSKGLLERQEVDGVWRYRSLQTREELDNNLVGQFVADSLRGSIHPFVLFLQGQGEISETDKEALTLLVKQWEAEGEKP